MAMKKQHKYFDTGKKNKLIKNCKMSENN